MNIILFSIFLFIIISFAIFTIKNALIIIFINLNYKYFHLQTSKILDVKWPLPAIFLESQQIITYPDEPVKTTIKYNGMNCSPSENVPVAVYILQLIYCGSSVTACYLQNNTYIQVNN